MDEEDFMDRLDYLQRCFADPIRLESDEFRKWAALPENRELYMAALAKRDAVRCSQIEVDVRREWENFNRSINIPAPHGSGGLRRAVYIAAAVAAACAALLILWRPQATEEPAGYGTAVLTTNDGKIIRLGAEAPGDVIESFGLAVSGDGNGIRYDNTYKTGDAALHHTLSTRHNTTFRITLSDGSHVWLNGASKLTYPQYFGSDQRVVELDGEAYFEVAGDAARPFIVRCGDVSTHVLGTSFNINSYSGSRISVTLVEGSIEVSNGGKSAVLAEGQNLKITDNGEMERSDVDTYAYTAWRDGYFYFVYATLGEIMESLGRWYDMDVRFLDESQRGLHFNFHARRDGTAGETLRMLSGIGRIDAHVADNTIVVE